MAYRWPTGPRRLAAGSRAIAVLGALCAMLAIAQTPAAGEAPPDSAGQRVLYDLYDEDLHNQGFHNQAADAEVGSFNEPVELFVALLDDCSSRARSSCGDPPVRWTADQQPVEFCTFQTGRPHHLDASEFRSRVAAMASYWSTLELAVGVHYTGDCPTGVRWEPDNGRNEISFDDSRNRVRGSAAAVTLSSWSVRFSGPQVSSKDLFETDIVLDAGIAAEPDRCFNSVLLHEMGHALGFGHSDDDRDLMYPSFTSGDENSCPLALSAAELTALRELYGVNRTPSVDGGPDRGADTGAVVQLSASGRDPDGDALTYSWRQTSGPAVTLQRSGALATFTAPAAEGSALTFEVTASDRYLHRATDSVTITVGSSAAPPAAQITFDRFVADASLARAQVEWGADESASSFQICMGSTLGGNELGCVTESEPSLAVTWDRVLGAAGAAGLTATTDGWRYTKIRACNSSGCTQFVDGPALGGVRWAARGVDYDYFAMGFDRGSIQFTIAGVVNLSPTPRNFVFRNGPPSDPAAQVIGGCSNVPSGGLCIDFLGVNSGRQYEAVEITSPGGRSGVTTRHVILVR